MGFTENSCCKVKLPYAIVHPCHPLRTANWENEMNKPSPEFADKLAHAAYVRRNWQHGMEYSKETLEVAFIIIRTARNLGYTIPSGETL